LQLSFLQYFLCSDITDDEQTRAKRVVQNPVNNLIYNRCNLRDIYFTLYVSQLDARLQFIVTIVTKMYAITIPFFEIIHLSIFKCFKIKLFRERLKREEK
jgi:hypothetical protein